MRGGAGGRQGVRQSAGHRLVGGVAYDHFSGLVSLRLEPGRLLAHRRTDGAREHVRADSERDHRSSGRVSRPYPRRTVPGRRGAGRRPRAPGWGRALMYWGARWLGRPLVLRFGPYVGLAVAKIELAERWSARYGWAGVFFSRLLPVIRHLIGIPAGILRVDFRWYSRRHPRGLAPVVLGARVARRDGRRPSRAAAGLAAPLLAAGAGGRARCSAPCTTFSCTARVPPAN